MTERATLLGGRYELGETLGTGGMAEVYRGRDTRLGRDVAVKILRSELAGDPTFIARFRREAQSAASLNHHNIVSVYDTGDDSGVPFIVMEYVEGRTLREVLRTEGRMLPQRALEIVADVCAALDYSHEQGIVHRDIKPGNVMLTPTGAVKVMDFGIARAITASTATMTQTAAVIGTAQYLSPEQARGEHVDARSDVYSTGCLVYELLTHRPPFTGDSPVAVAYQHVREDPPLPSSLNPDIDPATEAVVMKAMAKNPGNRYQTAGEMRDDLLRAAAGKPVRATPILSAADTTLLTPAATTMVLGTTPPPPVRRRGWGYVALALATLVVFVGSLLFVRSLIGGPTKRIATPDLTGMTVADATAALQDVGLKLGKVTQVFSDKKVGTIVGQEPIARITLSSGSEVDVEVSKGIRKVEVPELLGLQREDASRELERVGLKAKFVEKDVAGPPGRVIEQSPKAKTSVPVDSTVTVTVVSGRIEVPDLIGLTFAEARDRLEQLGFGNIVRRDVASTNPAEAGTVIGQDPAKGTKIGRNDPVTLDVAESPSPTPTPSDEPSPTPSSEPSPTGSPTP